MEFMWKILPKKILDIIRSVSLEREVGGCVFENLASQTCNIYKEDIYDIKKQISYVAQCQYFNFSPQVNLGLYALIPIFALGGWQDVFLHGRYVKEVRELLTIKIKDEIFMNA